MDTLKNVVIGVLVLLTLFLGASYFSKSLGAASGPSHYQMESFLQGVSAGARDQFSVSNVGALVSSAAATFGGLFKEDAGVLRSYTNSTSTTATTQTLVAADIANYDTVLLTPNTGALTLTFPASSTLSAFVPTAGDMAEQCWYNATSTAAATITVAGGTGIDLRTASSSLAIGGANLLVIPAGSGACFKYIREPATATTFNILTLMTRYAL